MKLVIEIPKDLYIDIKYRTDVYSGYINTIIRNGKPLDNVLNPIIKTVIEELKSILYGG